MSKSKTPILGRYLGLLPDYRTPGLTPFMSPDDDLIDVCRALMCAADVDEADDDLCPENNYDWSDEEGSGELKACEETQFGCCPDGITAADADGSECPSLTAVECHDSEFGCCPDGATPAHGLDLEGCPCSTTRYGCCADGVQPATGSHGEGCDETTTTSKVSASTAAVDDVTVCADTQHGCCLDGVEMASGPQFAGCPEYGSYVDSCEDSAFGCCPDGVSAAVGPFSAGCAYQRQIARLYSAITFLNL